MTMIKFLTQAKKLVAALAGTVGILVSSGYLHGNTVVWVNLAIGAVTSVLVYLLDNAPKAPAGDA